MKDRCTNKGHPKYRLYGGRGIRICRRWTTFVNFLEDMGDRPVGTSLDRINRDGGYCKKNCRWSTMSVQNSNRRSYTRRSKIKK